MTLFSKANGAAFAFSQVFFVCALGDDWNYEWDSADETGPFDWSDLYETCDGLEQSPVNIDAKKIANGFEAFGSELSAHNIGQNVVSDLTFLDVWEFSDSIYHLKAKNNGHSISLTPIDANGDELTERDDSIARFPNIFGSSDTASEYCLHSFHLHWGEFDDEGSEHTINGKSYPAEMHFVHYSCNFDDFDAAYNNASSLQDHRVLAVVGFLFQLDNDASDSETSLITKVTQRIDDLMEETNSTRLGDVKIFDNIVPKYMIDGDDRSKSNFWYYKGSLTTPSCDEIVQWHVMDYHPKITTSQLESLRQIKGSHGQMTHNWRPVQQNTNTIYKFEFADADEMSRSFHF